MTANIQIKIQCPMTCCLSFSLLPVSMNQKTHVSLTQFPVPALPGAYHSLPSCLFLLRLVWVSSCGLPFRPESLVSDSPSLCLAPGAVCHTDSPWAAAWLPACVSVSLGAPPARWLCFDTQTSARWVRSSWVHSRFMFCFWLLCCTHSLLAKYLGCCPICRRLGFKF